MTKDEMKDRISMALKDIALQQGFEIICKENARLENFMTNELNVAKDLIQSLSTCLESHHTNSYEYELIQKANKFLEEKNK